LVPSIHTLPQEFPMNVSRLFAAVMASGMLMAAPVLAQTSPAPGQPAQSRSDGMAPCGVASNTNPGGDPNCKQRTQNLVPSPAQAAVESTGRKP
jgi:hypothetical protein